MSKEFYLAQVSMDGDRERLQIEDVRGLAEYASFKFRGEDISPDLKPIEAHLEVCELCRDDVAYFTDALQSEFDAHMDFLSEHFENSG